MVTGDASIRVHIIAERCIFGTTNNAISILVGLIGAYFTCDIKYLKPIYSVCIFIQHLVLKIIDGQKVPDIVKRVLASLDNIQV